MAMIAINSEVKLVDLYCISVKPALNNESGILVHPMANRWTTGIYILHLSIHAGM